jgi:serine/threonine protein kinase
MLKSTLEDQLNIWRKEINKTLNIWCGPLGYCCGNRPILQQLWIHRVTVAKSVASAVAYLHQNEIIYRDLKPENIGFDQNGQVKIFDFGLAKRLLEDDMLTDGLYRLTGNTGSLRYMAPEVAMNKFYNLTADSYSFAIVFWQICSLTVPYAGYNVKMHADLVIGKGYRPKIERSWPFEWSHIMNSCWSSNLRDRLDFDTIVSALGQELDILITKQSAKNMTDIKAKKKTKDVEGTSLDVDTRIAFPGSDAFVIVGHNDANEEMGDTAEKLKDVDLV